MSPFLKTADTYASLMAGCPCLVTFGRCCKVLGIGCLRNSSGQHWGSCLGYRLLNGLIDLVNLHTPTVSTVMSHMLGCCGGTRCGGAVPSSLMKTLWNCSKRISAFSLLSHTNDPFLLGGYSNVVLFPTLDGF